jgi:hypothetical protein
MKAPPRAPLPFSRRPDLANAEAKLVTHQDKHEPQEVPGETGDDLQEADDLALEMLHLRTDMMREQQRRLVAVAQAISQGEQG